MNDPRIPSIAAQPVPAGGDERVAPDLLLRKVSAGRGVVFPVGSHDEEPGVDVAGINGGGEEEGEKTGEEGEEEGASCEPEWGEGVDC